MSRYDTLETNVARIIRDDPTASALVASDAIFTRREPQHRGRNLGRAPMVEIEVTGRSREMLCDDADLVLADLTITVSSKTLPLLNDTADAIQAALRRVENLNVPEDVGALNDWTIRTSRSVVGETQRMEIVVAVRLAVPTTEV